MQNSNCAQISIQEPHPIPESEPIRVLMVDDDELIGQMMRITLKHASGFKWLGQMCDSSEIAEVARRLRPHIVLLDLCMPGRSPFLAIEELRDHFPEVRVIIFSGRCGSSLVDRAVNAGAWGYISKENDGWNILASIRRVAAGEFVLSPNVQVECTYIA